MSEHIKTNTSQEKESSMENIADSISEISQKLDIINYFRPDATASEEQKRQFLSGEIDQPVNMFPNLEEVNIDVLKTDIFLAEETLNRAVLPRKYSRPYERQLGVYGCMSDMLESAKSYNLTQSLEDARSFMEANIEIYGEPDRKTYDGLVSGLRQDMLEKEFSGRAEVLKEELLAMLPEASSDVKPFRPKQETIDWVSNAVDVLYGDFLAIIPDKKKFTPTETEEIFSKALHEVIGEAASDWSVVLSDSAKSIDVDPSSRTIKIPDNDLERSKGKIESLMVHEIGVHVMRSIMGEGTVIESLRTGLPNYSEAEEGLAVVSEQALKGEYADRGVPYYLIAGGEYFHGQSFKEAYEITWRRGVLEGLKSNDDLTDEKIDKAKNVAYNQVFRINRGTNDLPWFKDLAYYNGNMKMWKYIEDHVGDSEAFINMYLGKIDPTDDLQMMTAQDARRI